MPEAHEVEAWGEPTFRVRNKIFASYAHDHHEDGRIAVWCKASWSNQDALLRSRPTEVFKPPYVGSRGWVGLHLTGRVDWAFVADIVSDSYRLIAPKRLLATLDP